MNNYFRKLPVPTEIIFGYGSISNVGIVVKKYGDKALIVCGRKSAKKYGHLKRVIEFLDNIYINLPFLVISFLLKVCLIFSLYNCLL